MTELDLLHKTFHLAEITTMTLWHLLFVDFVILTFLIILQASLRQILSLEIFDQIEVNLNKSCNSKHMHISSVMGRYQLLYTRK